MPNNSRHQLTPYKQRTYAHRRRFSCRCRGSMLLLRQTAVFAEPILHAAVFAAADARRRRQPPVDAPYGFFACP